MNLFQLWRTGVVNPSRAFEELSDKAAPQWGFWIVLLFNVAISLFTLLPLHLLGRGPQLESVLTFLPTEDYLVAEIFFLPVLRVVVWLLEGAIIHVGIRLSGRTSDFDQILNIGGLAYLVVMPPLMLSDWVLIALDHYQVTITAFTHGFVALWGLFLSIVGLQKLLDVKIWLAFGLSLLNMVVGISIFAIFAR
jgi:hypothetical protein